MTPVQIWWRHALPVLPLLTCSVVLFSITNADLWLAQHLFFDENARRWLGDGQWWANQLLHDGGGWLVRLIGVSAILCATASFCCNRLHAWRRPSLYLIVAMALTVGTVGMLKATTNVDCPWDLQLFNGPHPYIGLFADRPDALPVAKCFPAAHASSGYALMALYFMFRDRNRKWALAALAVGVMVGSVFGLGQQARGAHFVSHDVASFAIAWFSTLTLYVWGFRARLWALPEK